MILTQELIDSVTRDESTGKWIVPNMDSKAIYSVMCHHLAKHKPFSFARYGDGEWNALFQDTRQPSNCDGHLYYADMGARLKKIVESKPSYIMGLQPLSIQTRGLKINEVAEGVEWENSDCIHDASIGGYLDEMLGMLNKREVLLVGPPHLEAQELMPNAAMHLVASENCWNYYGIDLTAIKERIQGGEVILLCCSMMAEVMIDDLWHYRQDITVIDIGSVFDVFVGVNSRSYHHKMNVNGSK